MFSNDMMSPGLSAGYAAKRVPIVAKQTEVRMTPMQGGIRWRTGVCNTTTAAGGTRALPILFIHHPRLSGYHTALSGERPR
jgi:hypothetical protein